MAAPSTSAMLVLIARGGLSAVLVEVAVADGVPCSDMACIPFAVERAGSGAAHAHAIAPWAGGDRARSGGQRSSVRAIVLGSSLVTSTPGPRSASAAASATTTAPPIA